MKKVIAFDLDDTLAESKSPISDSMSELIGLLLEKYTVCIISGGRFEQFQQQVINNLRIDSARMEKLHIMPTSGTRYMRFDSESNFWQQVYYEEIPEKDKQRIIDAINRAVDHYGLREKKVYGNTIEDRGTQISFSALGQDIVGQLGPDGVLAKKQWDPDVSKRSKLRDFIADIIEDYEVRVGGATSIDITRPGVDKGYGITRLAHELKLSLSDILFIGDRLIEGGNDYPVKAIGVDTIAINSIRETELAIETLIKVQN